MDVSKRSECAVLKFLTEENVIAREIYRRMQNACVIEHMSRKSVLQCCSDFCKGRSNKDDRVRPVQARRRNCSCGQSLEKF